MIFVNLKKTYEGRTVLDIPELRLEEGKIYAIIGANGCGKSTLAKLISGIVSPDKGKVGSKGLKIGYMPQKSYAFRMSTRRNIRINRRKNANDSYEAELMYALKLDSLAKTGGNRLSGGETARMALARLFMGSYEIVVLDEPCSAMDIETTLLAEKLICDYRERTACAVLLITHSVAQAERIADEAIFLHNGLIIEQGDAKKLIHEPKNEKTKEFIEFYSK